MMRNSLMKFFLHQYFGCIERYGPSFTFLESEELSKSFVWRKAFLPEFMYLLLRCFGHAEVSFYKRILCAGLSLIGLVTTKRFASAYDDLCVGFVPNKATGNWLNA